ncbi:hypothetical protein [uncultured archaeal virus]|uniref:Uncharacterized protein n=1 Tax=uncultured archaeal virus TaxID=1960247 RepID=A0A8B0LNA8_9VIRU|nr:hypothetical protein [uncultured archaeal virus]
MESISKDDKTEIEILDLDDILIVSISTLFLIFVFCFFTYLII